ncbi:MAG: hypothetical protein ACK2UK_13425 [Candidatus Promineifilaceae bacterium]
MTGRDNQQNIPTAYEIRIKGFLGDEWAEWFEGMTVTRTVDGETLLSGSVVDQAALYGLLRKVRDLGLPLISVVAVDGDQADGLDSK